MATVRDPDMPFMNRLLDSASHRRASKRPRVTHPPPTSDFDMAFFAQAPTHLAPPPRNLGRKRSDRHLSSRNEVEEYLSSSDLELSFASNVSLNSPPHRTSGLPDCEPMDISPMPPQKFAKAPSGLLATKTAAPRPRALTSNNSRLFGSDLSNSNKLADPPSTKGTAGNKKLARSALPTEWMAAMRPPPEPQSIPTAPSSPTDDAMDVDTSYIMEAPPDLAPAPAAEGIANFFFDTMSPSKKRRSLSPEGSPAMVHNATSSPMLPPSPSEAKLNRMAAAGRIVKPSLQGLGAPSGSFVRRPRRPVLSEMVHPTSHGAQSAYPLLSAGLDDEDAGLQSAPPVRRAFSALLPPSVYIGDSEGDSSFDADGPDMSSPAQAYAKRQHVKTIRRCDGTEDFRPLTGASALVMNESPKSRLKSPGLPGHGDNEAHGKILPCHRVADDGLMRITPQTLDALIDGKYDNGIHDYHIIDCRFDYEYNGGHIKGAVNINSEKAVEELLLGPSLTKPRPSTSGDSTRKTILVFHCEFSAMRAPTFAKHLRSKDRAVNNHIYPKIHYPEVGYCQYFKSSGHRCDPPAYITMKDPRFSQSCEGGMDQFRKVTKFGRHKSYAYGEGGMMKTSSTSSSQQGAKRNTAPVSLFAAAASASVSAADEERDVEDEGVEAAVEGVASRGDVWAWAGVLRER
ncbi:hypothetical protein D9611_004274 [Ephemerocybe angulata]|uniref:M-phase inducer phosphatase n=1 Tax=Ephemerocybe angulata TaxID=980116 RepID=A0A8H5F5G0_9AGAR|nr:hypothetical protein D9611_004274 [Tulosesus angulatus]